MPDGKANYGFLCGSVSTLEQPITSGDHETAYGIPIFRFGAERGVSSGITAALRKTNISIPLMERSLGACQVFPAHSQNRCVRMVAWFVLWYPNIPIAMQHPTFFFKYIRG